MSVFVFVQHRLGRTDGVSLEVDKWRTVLEEMGHTVHYMSGNDDVPGGHFIPELYPFHPQANKIMRNCTSKLEEYATEQELLEDIRRHAAIVKQGMRRIIGELNPDVLLPNNLLSVGYNVPGMLALSEILAETGIRAICHNHDFWWEGREVFPTCQTVIDLYRRHAPPDYPNVQHVTINRIGQRELREQRGIESTVVPNVWDFRQPAWVRDEFNHDFRQAINVSERDIVFLQATRVVDRKAIELAVDLVAELNRPEHRARLEEGPLYDGRRFGASDRLVLVCAGYLEQIGGGRQGYQPLLDARAREKGVEIRWVGDIVQHSRGHAQGRKIYSLWDSYVFADFVTYPSLWEGWGNQFVEAIFARLPICLFEYPVYLTDLKQHNFRVASLGSEIAGTDANGLAYIHPRQLAEAAASTVRYLKERDLRRDAVDHNYRVAEEHFSLRALRRAIETLLQKTK